MSQRLESLLSKATTGHLLALAQRRKAANESMLRQADPSMDVVEVNSEVRRYLAAFDAWLRFPSEENAQIKASALRAMVQSCAD